MPVRYSKQISKTGVPIGTIVSIVRPSTYTTSTNEDTEAANWDITNDYPGWLECDGRTLNVSQYRALYSIIGNTYGGTINSTFVLPDYRSKKICGTGALNGNSGASLSLPAVNGPTGTPGGSEITAGSTGGLFVLNTARQLPSGSEISVGSPGSPNVIGGNSVDTFSLGTYRTEGFESVTESRDMILSGNLTFGIGPITETTVAAVPPHIHFMDCVEAGTQKATVAPAAPMPESYNFYEDAEGSVRSFNRALRRWPGAATGGGFGDLEFQVEASTAVANGTFVLGQYVRVENYGSGAGENGGFSDYGSPLTNQYVNFWTTNGGTVSRQATWTVDATGYEVVSLYAIAGNDSNGGERVNTAGESLRIQFNDVEQGIILPSKGDSEFAGDSDFTNFDNAYANWFFKDFTIPTQYRVPNLRIKFIQTASPETNNAGSGDYVDNFGIAKLILKGTGGTFEYADGGTPIVLQKHSHMIFWDDPNTGDIVPGVPVTYGSGGGSDFNFDGTRNGLKNGTGAVNAATPNNSIGDTITKTITLADDMGLTVTSGRVTMSIASRLTFDAALSVRLEAADEIVLLSPYFRTKYIIKAY